MAAWPARCAAAVCLLCLAASVASAEGGRRSTAALLAGSTGRRGRRPLRADESAAAAGQQLVSQPLTLAATAAPIPNITGTYRGGWQVAAGGGGLSRLRHPSGAAVLRLMRPLLRSLSSSGGAAAGGDWLEEGEAALAWQQAWGGNGTAGVQELKGELVLRDGLYVSDLDMAWRVQGVYVPGGCRAAERQVGAWVLDLQDTCCPCGCSCRCCRRCHCHRCGVHLQRAAGVGLPMACRAHPPFEGWPSMLLK